VYSSTSAGDLPDVALGPLYTFTSGAWEDHVKQQLSRILSVPEVRFVKIHANFLEAVMTYFFKPYFYHSIAV